MQHQDSYIPVINNDIKAILDAAIPINENFKLAKSKQKDIKL